MMLLWGNRLQVANPEFFMKTVPLLDDGDDVAMVLSPQCFYNTNADADIFNHSNIHFWECVARCSSSHALQWLLSDAPLGTQQKLTRVACACVQVHADRLRRPILHLLLR